MESLRKLLEIYYEQGIKSKLDFRAFIMFLRTDDNQASQNLFESLLPRYAEKKIVETKVIVLMLMNCIPSLSKLERLKFAFSLYDEEDSRMLVIEDLQRILQANYFAGLRSEVQGKVNLIMEQAVASGSDFITFDDFMSLGQRFSALFFPLNI